MVLLKEEVSEELLSTVAADVDREQNIPPLITFCAYGVTPTMFRSLLSTPCNNAPIKVSMIEPRPRERFPHHQSGDGVELEADARVLLTAHQTRAKRTPDQRVACSLPLIAYTYGPNGMRSSNTHAIA